MIVEEKGTKMEELEKVVVRTLKVGPESPRLCLRLLPGAAPRPFLPAVHWWHWGIALGISTGALVHWHSGASADHCLICCVIVIRGARWVGGGYNNSALTN